MRWLNKQLTNTVIVHTTTKESLRGVLVGVYKDCLVLAHVYYLNTDSAPTEVDGEAIVPRSQVAWVQKMYDVGGER